VENETIITKIREAAYQRILFLPHALNRMNAPARMITPVEIRSVVETGIVVENYPTDPRGHSCLMLGFGKQGRPLHVVCAPRQDYLAIITVYLPDAEKWEADWQTRKE